MNDKSSNLSLVLLVLIGIVGFTGCASPTARIESKVAEFQRKYPDHFVTYQAASRQMNFAWSGDSSKQPIIFVHGSPGSWSGWAEFLLNEDLQKRFHIIAVDRPGYGGSGAGKTETSLKRQADDVALVLRLNTSGKKAILVGHSYGGAVIAQMAADLSQLVAALIFVASSVDPAMEHIKWYQYPASWWPFRVLIPTALRVCNEEIFPLKEELALLEPRWQEIKARVATIQGVDDSLVPASNQAFILKKISANQIKYRQLVPGMNHFVPWEHPELILEAISIMAALPAE